MLCSDHQAAANMRELESCAITNHVLQGKLLFHFLLLKNYFNNFYDFFWVIFLLLSTNLMQKP